LRQTVTPHLSPRQPSAEHLGKPQRGTSKSDAKGVSRIVTPANLDARRQLPEKTAILAAESISGWLTYFDKAGAGSIEIDDQHYDSKDQQSHHEAQRKGF
jgi:hypothetical protein